MLTILNGFFDEMQKIAFGSAEAKKVLSLVKARQLPKASRRLIPGLSAVQSGSQIAKDIRRSRKGMHSALGPELGELAATTVFNAQINSPMGRLSKQNPVPMVFPGRGTPTQQLNRMHHPGMVPLTHVPTKQQKMLNAVLKGHELDESSVPGRLGAGQYGHRSPDVIFREHNRLVTLPPGNEEVQTFMKQVRNPRPNANTQTLISQMGLTVPARARESTLFPPQIQYGEGARLSRHARRRLTDLAEQKELTQLAAHKNVSRAELTGNAQ